ncbi:MAG TPA: hypothetical protein VFN35_25140, partial [Ktedonobacteraceae bacterium]|nr:hypothetical protein [Ktedonobacteraceae bacterium]
MSEERSSESRRTEASELLASVESQDVLSTDPALRITIASDPATPVSLLESLAQDQDARVREQVANNPNTPWSTLERLAWEFPRAFLFNPVGPLHLLEHPEQVCTEKTFWDTILREATIPILWWKWLSSHPLLRKSEAVRLHIQFAGEAAHPFGIPKIGEEYTLLTLVELLSAASAQGMP